MIRIYALVLVLFGCGDVSLTQPSNAQAIGPNGLPYVHVIDGGICAGNGTTGAPLTCAMASDGVTVTGTGSAGSPFAVTVAPHLDGIFCDGSDGAVTFDGSSTVLGLVPSGSNYTMTRDICCNGCTINAGVAIFGSWRFFDYGTLTLNGRIANNGGSGGNGSTTTGTAGSLAGSASGFMSRSLAGGAGSTTNGANGGSVNAPNGCSATGGSAPSGNGNTCTGGAGGGGTGTGGAGGGASVVSDVVSDSRSFLESLDMLTGRNNVTSINVGAGGGGGGGSTGFAGGGGGGGGAPVLVGAKRITGSGSIESKGGNGGNGNAGGNTGGGGGGAGGYVVVYVLSGSFPTITVTGGTHGTGNGTGTNGGNGGSGIAKTFRIGAN
jgi:hypothetical protein